MVESAAPASVSADDIGDGTERFVPGHTTFPHSAEQHMLRYVWASEQLIGKRHVLDAACGVGYGSRMLRDGLGAQVVGCDLSARAIRFATAEYGAPGLTFVQDDCQTMAKFEDRTFDGAVSFETVEHVPDRVALVASLHRVLRPGAPLLISTPDRRLTSVLYPFTGRPHCGHHLIEFSLEEFVALMSSKFIVKEIWGQSFVPAALSVMPVQILVKAVAHKLLGRRGRNFLETTYWRGTGTSVQSASQHPRMLANFNVLICEAK